MPDAIEPYGIFGIFVLCLLAVRCLMACLRGSDIRKKKPRIGRRGWKLFYSDEKTTERKENVIYSKILVSKTYQISGKPDFIYRHKRNGLYMPVELKSGSIGSLKAPRTGDMMQLIAYFVIIEDLYGTRPREGQLIYSDAMFVIKNRKKFRDELFRVTADMREMLCTGKRKVNANFVKCKHCVCRGTVCEFME